MTAHYCTYLRGSSLQNWKYIVSFYLEWYLSVYIVLVLGAQFLYFASSQYNKTRWHIVCENQHAYKTRLKNLTIAYMLYENMFMSFLWALIISFVGFLASLQSVRRCRHPSIQCTKHKNTYPKLSMTVLWIISSNHIMVSYSVGHLDVVSFF